MFRLVNIEKDRIILRVWLSRGDYGAECIMPRTEFMAMLENIFDSLLADSEYIKLITVLDSNGMIQEEIKEFYEDSQGMITMLKERILYDSVDADIEDYNLDNPHNVFNR